MCICGCGSAKSHRKPIANLRLRNTSCSFAEFAVAELSLNLRCPALLICDACSTYASVRLRCVAGLFNYDIAFGIDFAKSNQPVSFINLKKSIARHIAAKTH